uniref:Uncharacterized protein n=1 Tax=Aplanochytrium stocchinoi TaxID=215587 RepID=A0A7S3V228_9STRA|mmetsp:Transcript_31726/g.39130  ORF Transcript_31726/g.39130 Transcript_31726/m.39130 type:complete len:419 (+) Transcript_31726:354-1610(+)|eukprot:CAMPEP_0204833970 /NCGR_PEP_ID=MMETSP1346-20131115/18432_1 /ASSEMBLY_ACC=CAM_ASM_000771 /TAXON_ID=215587 /ORGANISM="Aplanochytrium stocchinoi, Strain GSBS06" /LENGTH=418 /DNA_ID=CAMNT_0051966933 /DNA_START=254 /DNA_END=1513 /DNA_ORIENTATION=-
MTIEDENLIDHDVTVGKGKNMKSLFRQIHKWCCSSILVLLVALLIFATFVYTYLLANRHRHETQYHENVKTDFILEPSPTYMQKEDNESLISQPLNDEIHRDQLSMKANPVEVIDHSKEIVSLMHISKTGVTTLYREMRHLRKYKCDYCVDVNFAFVSPGFDEQCRVDLERRRGGKRIGSLFRNPLSHVYSQYLECKYDRWGRIRTHGTEFPRDAEDEKTGRMPAYEKWLHHFIDDVHDRKIIPNRTRTDHNDYRCYHPYNMQTRYLFCDSYAQDFTGPRTEFPHHFDGTSQLKDFDPLQVKKILREMWFVGILEYYDVSVCMFKYQVSGVLPPTCGCEKASSNSTDGSSATAKTGRKRKILVHGVPKHSLSNLSENIISMTKQLVRQDLETYEMAKAEYFSRVETLREKTGIKLICT